MMINFLDIDLLKFYNYFLIMVKVFKLKSTYFNLLFAAFFVFINFNAVAKDKSPEPVTWNSYLKEAVFGDDVINDGTQMFSLDTPYRALDAAIVPISINFNTPQSKTTFVKSLTLIVDENPSPLVSKFNFTPKVGNASLTTRVRIDKYTYVRAIVEMNNGEKYMNSNFVKAAGGCSAPSLADMDTVMARLGKMKMKFFETGNNNSPSKAQFLISHPNFSGLQFNQLTRAEIPAHFVNYIKIEQDNELIIEAYPDISMSEDPSITFHFLDSGSPLKVTVEDSEGKNFAGNFPLSSVISKNF
jgi:sulfur-oxidizing protein SoxY